MNAIEALEKLKKQPELNRTLIKMGALNPLYHDYAEMYRYFQANVRFKAKMEVYKDMAKLYNISTQQVRGIIYKIKNVR